MISKDYFDADVDSGKWFIYMLTVKIWKFRHQKSAVIILKFR